MDNQTKLIKITHIVNPSRFYCYDVNAQGNELMKIKVIEKRLSDLAEKQDKCFNTFYSPQPGDLVAYFCKSRKWIRAEVEEFNNYSGESILILWTIDYGLPVYTKKLEDVFPLPETFRFPQSKIFVAGLSVLPSTFRFDHVNCKVIKEFTEEWSELAIKAFETCIVNALEINFVLSSNASHFDVMIGEILVGDHSVVDYCINSKLVRENLAIEVPPKEFFSHYKRLFTNNIERWNDNRRSGGVLKGEEGVMKSVIDMADKLERFKEVDYAASASTLQSYVEEGSCKVKDWMKRNEEIMQRKLAGDNESEVSSSVHSVGSIIEFKLPQKKQNEEAELKSANSSLTMSSQQLRELLVDCPDDGEKQDKPLKSNHKMQKMIFLPAGAQMQTNNRNPRYQSVAGTATNETFDDDQFVSVSQVGAESSAQSNSNF